MCAVLPTVRKKRLLELTSSNLIREIKEVRPSLILLCCLHQTAHKFTMGYDKLDAALAWPQNIPPAGSNIVITDTLKSNGNFLLHHFISNHLRANQRVIVVGLSQIFNHYFLIGRKLVQFCSSDSLDLISSKLTIRSASSL